MRPVEIMEGYEIDDEMIRNMIKLNEGDNDDNNEEDIVNKRKRPNLNIEKNSWMMAIKHDHERNKTTREFELKDKVSISIPRIDYGKTDLRRLLGIVVKVSGDVKNFRMLQLFSEYSMINIEWLI